MWWCLLAVAAGLLVTAVSVRRQFTVVTVAGDSMMPTLAPGDRVLVRRTRASQIRRGQVVVLQRPDAHGCRAGLRHPASRGGAWMIKRVAALPGDIRPADCLPTTAGSVARRVPPGQLVVLGDNASWSQDSRQFGYLPAQRVLGVVVRQLGERRIPQYQPTR
jgi:signal peptidase I